MQAEIVMSGPSGVVMAGPVMVSRPESSINDDASSVTVLDPEALSIARRGETVGQGQRELSFGG